MKFIWGLSGVAIVSCLSLNSGVAMGKATEQVSNPTSPSRAEPVMIADFFRIFQDAVQTIQQVDQAIDLVDSVIQQENRRQELEAARQAATEQDRLEAERRQQYFESLSPEQQQAYIEEQRAMQAQRDQAANLFLLGVMSLMFGGSSSESEPAASPYEDAPECQMVDGWLRCQ